MSSSRLAAIERVVERGIKAGGYPGASVVVGAAVFERVKLSWLQQHGRCRRTIYDVPSEQGHRHHYGDHDPLR
jgi:hypothetical protein